MMTIYANVTRRSPFLRHSGEAIIIIYTSIHVTYKWRDCLLNGKMGREIMYQCIRDISVFISWGGDINSTQCKRLSSFRSRPLDDKDTISIYIVI